MTGEEIRESIRDGSQFLKIEQLQNLLNKEKKNIYFFYLGVLYISQKNYSEAEQFLSEGLKHFPADAALFGERAVANFHLQQLRPALADANKAVELDPANPYRYTSRAWFRDSMGDINGAVADYKIALQLDPDELVAINNYILLKEKVRYINIKQKNRNNKYPTQPHSKFSIIKKVFTQKKDFLEFINYLKKIIFKR